MLADLDSRINADKSYQEIVNIQEFSFESFWSAVGGFLGMFLGYSLLQLPELLGNIPVLFGKMTSYLKKDHIIAQ